MESGKYLGADEGCSIKGGSRPPEQSAQTRVIKPWPQHDDIGNLWVIVVVTITAVTSWGSSSKATLR